MEELLSEPVLDFDSFEEESSEHVHDPEAESPHDAVVLKQVAQALSSRNLEVIRKACSLIPNNIRLVDIWTRTGTEDNNNPPHSTKRLKSPLHIAIQTRDVAVTEYILITQGFQDVLQDKRMCSILHLCVQDTINLGNSVIDRIKRILKLLLEYNKQLIHEEDEHSLPPLLVPGIHIDLLKYLIESGANLKALAKNGNTILHRAAWYLSPKDYHCLSTYLAVECQGHHDLFRVKNKAGCTPLHYTVQNLESFQYLGKIFDTFKLLEVDFNSSDSCGNPVLFYAIKGQRTATIIDSLINKFGVDPSKRNKALNTPLQYAVYHGNLEAAKYFITHQRHNDVNAKDSQGRTALYWTLRNPYYKKSFEGVQLLLENGADVNAVDNQNETPLRWTVLTWREPDDIVELMKYLIDHGADVDKSLKDGSRFLHWVPYYLIPCEYHALVQHLVETGRTKSITARDMLGRSVLHRALLVLEPFESTLELFAKCKFDFSSVDNNGKSIRDYAEISNLSREFSDLLASYMENGGGTNQ